MSKADRLSRIIEVYLQGDLDLDTAVAELMHVYVERGWRFSLIEGECDPNFRERMHALATEVDREFSGVRGSTGGTEIYVDPPIVIR